MSKFDYSDSTSLDPALTDSRRVEYSSVKDQEAPVCFWCGEPVSALTDYCSALCASYAAHDSRED